MKTVSRDDGPVLVSIQIGPPRELAGDGGGDRWAGAWTTGIFKTPVAAGAVAVGVTNVAGDGQADPVNHGGPDKAVCAYSADHYDEWRLMPELAGIGPGGFGENFTIRGLTESAVCVGDLWRIGGVLVQVSQPRQPCWKLARKWGIRDFAARVIASGRTGWYFRVVEEGRVEAGARLTLVERRYQRWTVHAANDVMHGRPIDTAASAELAALPALSRSWRKTLGARAPGNHH